jgi:hypothetical protein
MTRAAVNFALAAAQHLLRGAPRCSQEEINARLDVCRGCPLFDGTICRHGACGCRVNGRRRFFNKLAWADQSCPLDKWTAIVRDP